MEHLGYCFTVTLSVQHWMAGTHITGLSAWWPCPPPAANEPFPPPPITPIKKTVDRLKFV